MRILAATSANIDRALAEKKLREDLYYRLSAFTVQVPPLRQRRDEIAVLVAAPDAQAGEALWASAAGVLAVRARCLPGYAWPGNLNELEAFVKRYLVAGDQELAFPELDSSLARQRQRKAASTHDAEDSDHSGDERRRGGPSGQESLKSLIQSVKCEAERNAIGAALQKTGWNRKAAARLLEVSYRTLLYKIEQYHMTRFRPVYFPAAGRETWYFRGHGVKGNGKVS